MKVAIIGAGLIGNKRAEALSRLDGWSLVAVVDKDLERASQCCKVFGGKPFLDWRPIVSDSAIDLVIVSTFHDVAVPIVLAALEQGKHVLCEKPLGRNSSETEAILNLAEKSKGVLKTGFNYRHYEAFKKAKSLIVEGCVGDVTHIRTVLGHAARPEYNKEWRTHAQAGGGGALLDPGIHLLDLLRFFLGDFEWCSFVRQNSFWEMPYEDNVMMLLRSKRGQTAYLHSSITEWKNNLSFDIFGTEGYIKISGRGGFYGQQKICWNRKWAWLNPNENPQEKQEIYPDKDNSFYEELLEFRDAILENRLPMGNGRDALYAAKLIDAVYNNGGKSGVIVL